MERPQEQDMTYLVVYQSADGSAGYEPCTDLDAAVVAAERLRNVDDVDQPRIFKTEEITISFRPYYRVEVDGETGAAPTPEPSAGVVAAAPLAVDVPAEEGPANSGADWPVMDAPAATPAPEPVEETAPAVESFTEHAAPVLDAAVEEPVPMVDDAAESFVPDAAEVAPVDVFASNPLPETDAAAESVAMGDDIVDRVQGLVAEEVDDFEPPTDFPAVAPIGDTQVSEITDFEEAAVPPRRGLFGR